MEVLKSFDCGKIDFYQKFIGCSNMKLFSVFGCGNTEVLFFNIGEARKVENFREGHSIQCMTRNGILVSVREDMVYVWKIRV